MKKLNKNIQIQVQLLHKDDKNSKNDQNLQKKRAQNNDFIL